MEILESINTVYYELYCKPLGSIVIQEPDGWKDDSRSLERDKDAKSITTKSEVRLTFYGDGAEFISTVYYGFGLMEKVLLVKRERNINSLEEEWKLRYVQELDLAEFDEDSRTGAVKVKATEGGLFDDIKARQGDEYNLINQESADGENIGPIKTYPFGPESRGIFLETLFQDSDVTNYKINGEVVGTETIHLSRNVPMTNIYNSDETNVRIPDSHNEMPTHNVGYEVGQDLADLYLCYYNTDIPKTMNLTIDVKGTITDIIQSSSQFNTRDDFSVAILKTRNKPNDELYHEIIEVIELNYYQGVNIGDSFEGIYNGSIDVSVEEGFAVVVASHQYGYGLDMILNFSKSEVRIADSTQYPNSYSRCMKPIDLFDRLVAKITGQTGLVRSDCFGSGGDYEHFVVDNGFWARQFPDKIEKDNGESEEIQFVTSFQDAFESFSYLEPLSWFIDTEGERLVVRIEKATYTQRNFIGISLGEVTKVSRKSSGGDWFQTIELGHEGDLDYEEVNGLDEPNGKSEFSTPLKRGGGRYSVVSKYRFDSIGYELIRRKDFENYPKEDTDRDKDIWIHDAKPITLLEGDGDTHVMYMHNLWQDVGFVEAPRGIFDPDSAFNLRLSPMNRLIEGHGYAVKRCLYHAPDKVVRFNSSNANQNLITRRVIRDIDFVIEEKGWVRIRNLEHPRIEPTETEVTFKMTPDIEDQFFGFKVINGRAVPNYFGLIQYIEKGQKKYGRLVKLSTKNESKLTMINAKL